MTCRTLEDFYHIDGHTFEKQYKETLSGFRSWEQLAHADEWILFPDNIGPRLAIDEFSMLNGELYAFVTNRDRHTHEGSLVAVVAGTRSEDVIQVLKQIKEEAREAVEEVTLDLSDSMCRIVTIAFPKAKRVIDCFHIQKLACEAVQEIRVAHRWDALQQSNGMIFSRKTIMDVARLSMARWYNKVDESRIKSFNVIAGLFINTLEMLEKLQPGKIYDAFSLYAGRHSGQELCEQIVDASPLALRLIPEEYKTSELCRRVLHNCTSVHEAGIVGLISDKEVFQEAFDMGIFTGKKTHR